MIVIECDQGSPEWLAARAGVITASMFAVARSRVGGLSYQQEVYVTAIRRGASVEQAMEAAGYKSRPRAEVVERALDGEKVGDWSDAAKDYAFRVAVERISGAPLDDGFQTWAMRRGHELEPEARMEHEVASGLVVRRAGFVTTDDGLFGASADGFIGRDEGAEYKCFIDPSKLRAFHIDGNVTSVWDQVQGCLWLTGRKRWHVGLYCPALRPAGRALWLRTFDRDEAYIEQLEAGMMDFSFLVAAYEAQLREPCVTSGAGPKRRKPVPAEVA